MTGKTPRRTDERGQAFTLEGFIASVVVLSAVLFALQALVFTPTSAGQVDEQVRDKLRTEARDVLTASANNGTEDLSHHVRYFSNDTSGDTWVGNSGSLQQGYGEDKPLSPGDTVLGNGMNQTFNERGFSYNIQLEYLSATEANETDSVPMVFRGVPTEEAVSVTYTVVLYDNETLTVPDSASDCADIPIEGISQNTGDANWDGDANNPEKCVYPIPEAELFDDDDNTAAPTGCVDGNTDITCETAETGDSPIYNIVEVRVVIW